MTIAKPFSGSGGNLSGLVSDIAPVTPHDTNPIRDSGEAVFLRCTVDGDVDFITAVGETRTGFPMVAHTDLPVGVTHVLTSSTATVWAYLP